MGVVAVTGSDAGAVAAMGSVVNAGAAVRGYFRGLTRFVVWISIAHPPNLVAYPPNLVIGLPVVWQPNITDCYIMLGYECNPTYGCFISGIYSTG